MSKALLAWRCAVLCCAGLGCAAVPCHAVLVALPDVCCACLPKRRPHICYASLLCAGALDVATLYLAAEDISPEPPGWPVLGAQRCPRTFPFPIESRLTKRVQKAHCRETFMP
jgi:hypothetical protein